jgi:hypothetical protein
MTVKVFIVQDTTFNGGGGRMRKSLLNKNLGYKIFAEYCEKDDEIFSKNVKYLRAVECTAQYGISSLQEFMEQQGNLLIRYLWYNIE